jgi:hypothetical protein
VPAPIDLSLLLVGTTFAQVTGGRYGVCAPTTTGSVYCWGDAGTGALGFTPVPDGPTTRPTRPVATSTLPAGDLSASVDYQDTAVCAVTTRGAGYCRG